MVRGICWVMGEDRLKVQNQEFIIHTCLQETITNTIRVELHLNLPVLTA